MKMKITRAAKTGLAAFLLTCGLVICAHAQSSTLTFKNGKASVRKVVRPRKKSDADFYTVRLRQGQLVSINVASGGLYLSKENECGMFFELFDDQGEAVWIGDSMVGIDEWEGKIEKTGNYKIKVAMQCIEGFEASELRKKKPTFKYTLTVGTR